MLFIGALTGWMGSKIFPDGGLGHFGNIIVGILGSSIGYWLFGELDIHIGSILLSSLITGTTGAVGFLILLNLLFSGRKR